VIIFTNEDKILAKILSREKGYSGKEILEEFPDEQWSRSTLDQLLWNHAANFFKFAIFMPIRCYFMAIDVLILLTYIIVKMITF